MPVPWRFWCCLLIGLVPVSAAPLSRSQSILLFRWILCFFYQLFMDNNQFEAVISLPSGVFKPYAGVSTAIIIFTKGGQTKNVFFYDVQSDGYTLDDKRTQIGDGKGDLADVLEGYQRWSDGSRNFGDRKEKAFEVSVEDIRSQGYDLSISRYREKVHAAVVHESPAHLLQKLKELEREISAEIQSLEELL